jgi:hypothetical protein
MVPIEPCDLYIQNSDFAFGKRTDWQKIKKEKRKDFSCPGYIVQVLIYFE